MNILDCWRIVFDNFKNIGMNILEFLKNLINFYEHEKVTMKYFYGNVSEIIMIF
jgi:hypothetical protein